MVKDFAAKSALALLWKLRLTLNFESAFLTVCYWGRDRSSETFLIIWAEGEDEREAVEALEKLVASNFGEGE